MNTYGRTNKLLIIVVVVIGVLILGSDSSGKRVDDTFSPIGDITNIQIENGSVDIKLIEGDSFYVKGENLEEDSYLFTQEGSTLIIKTDKHNFEFFHIGLLDEPERITITIPRDIQFNVITLENGSGDLNATTRLHTTQCSITVGSGDVDLEGIQAETFDINIGSSDFTIKDLIANSIDVTIGSGDTQFGYIECDKMRINVGSGDFIFKSLEARDCELEIGSGEVDGRNVQVMNMSAETGSGDIYLMGELSGVSDFRSGSGDIELNLDGDIDEYSFEIEGSDIEVNGKDYDKNYKSDKTMDKQLRLKSNSGDIDVTIR